MTEVLIILGCAAGFAVMGLLTRGLAHPEHDHHHAGSDDCGSEANDEACSGCSLHCETTEAPHV
jgi:hypothetical protein